MDSYLKSGYIRKYDSERHQNAVLTRNFLLGCLVVAVIGMVVMGNLAVKMCGY